MKKYFAFCISIPLLLAACSKDLAIPEPQIIYPNYTPMTVGSYWVYDWYKVDASGNTIQQLSETDSVYIAGDTIIGTDTFAIQVGTWFGGAFSPPFRNYLRNLNGDLVSPSGAIGFSATNYIDTFYIWNPGNGQTMGYRKMIDIGEIVTVPVGTFRTLNAAYIVVNLVGTWPCIGIYDIHDNQYAENIGLVRTSFQFVGSCEVFEGRLRTYYIAP